MEPLLKSGTATRHCDCCGAELLPEFKRCPYCLGKKGRRKKAHKRANGTGSCFKPADRPTWQIKYIIGYDENGNAIYKKEGGFKTEKAALTRLDEVCTARSFETFEDMYNSISKEVERFSGRTQQKYALAYKRLEPLHKMMMFDITTRDLREVIIGYSFDAAKDMHTIMNKCFDEAMANGIVQVKLSNYVRLPDKTYQEKTPFTIDEIKLLWKAWNERKDIAAGYALVMIYTGMRYCELEIVRNENIDFKHRKIIGAGRKTKKSKETPISFTKGIEPVIREISDLGGELFLIWKKDRFYNEFQRACARAGTEILTPGCCRHTTATVLLTLDESLKKTSEVLRHENQSTTEDNYAHLSVISLNDRQVEETLSALDELIDDEEHLSKLDVLIA